MCNHRRTPDPTCNGTRAPFITMPVPWLQDALGNSTAPWKVVMLHHAPFSSGTSHGSNPRTQWPFQTWGADVVLSGHDHLYERILKNGGFPYFVNGLGGASIYGFGSAISGQQPCGTLQSMVKSTLRAHGFAARQHSTLRVWPEASCSDYLTLHKPCHCHCLCV